MPGERWPDKRARAVVFAGANRLQKDHPEAGLDPDRIADLALAVRSFVFTDEEVREENADVKAHRIGYSADCMQFATIEPDVAGLALDLWLGAERAAAAKKELGAQDPANAFRRLYGWVRIAVGPGTDVDALVPWIQTARRHAAETKAGQQIRM